MNVFDFHCDSLYKSLTQNIPLNSDSLEVRLNQDCLSHKLQCYAIWLPDDLSESEAENLFFKAHKRLAEQCKLLSINLVSSKIQDNFYNYKNSAVFTVENGSALNGKIENIKLFAELGVRMITLTWNGHNSLGDGVGVECPVGITEFGKRAVKEMETNGIVVDISHASPQLFYDVAEIAQKPFVASHSNSYSVANHKRNLTDEQFKIIVENNGIVGLNFHREFLNSDAESASKYDLLKHIEHFMALGGENSICLGSDFDGCELPNDINNSEFYNELYEILLRENYKEAQIKNIFYNNALNFSENFDNQRNM